MISQAFQNDFAGVGVVRLASVLDLTNHLTPALSPNFVGGEGESFEDLPNNLRLDWSCSHSQNRDLTIASPLLGERKQARASVSTNYIFN